MSETVRIHQYPEVTLSAEVCRLKDKMHACIIRNIQNITSLLRTPEQERKTHSGVGICLREFCQPVGYVFKFNEVEMDLFHWLLFSSVLNGCIQSLKWPTPIEVQTCIIVVNKIRWNEVRNARRMWDVCTSTCMRVRVKFGYKSTSTCRVASWWWAVQIRSTHIYMNTYVMHTLLFRYSCCKLILSTSGQNSCFRWLGFI